MTIHGFTAFAATLLLASGAANAAYVYVQWPGGFEQVAYPEVAAESGTGYGAMADLGAGVFASTASTPESGQSFAYSGMNAVTHAGFLRMFGADAAGWLTARVSLSVPPPTGASLAQQALVEAGLSVLTNAGIAIARISKLTTSFEDGSQASSIFDFSQGGGSAIIDVDTPSALEMILWQPGISLAPDDVFVLGGWLQVSVSGQGVSSDFSQTHALEVQLPPDVDGALINTATGLPFSADWITVPEPARGSLVWSGLAGVLMIVARRRGGRPRPDLMRIESRLVLAGPLARRTRTAESAPGQRRPTSFSARIPVRLGTFVITGALALFAIVASPTQAAESSPFGTIYTATATNLPGNATVPLTFDGLPKPLGGSGLVVREKATSFGAHQLLEFSLRTADGDGFVGQQSDPMAPASVSVANLQWAPASVDPENPEEPTPARAEADSGFLWLSIDGEAQALSDVAGLGLRFGTHPLDASIPIVYIDNAATTQLGFDTFGETTFATFTALVGATLAPQIDAIHLGVAAAPVPEPGVGFALIAGCAGLLALDRFRRRRPLAERRSLQRIGARTKSTLRGAARLAAGLIAVVCLTALACPHELRIVENPAPAGSSRVIRQCAKGNVLQACPEFLKTSETDWVVCLTPDPSSPLPFESWGGVSCDDGDFSSVLECDGPDQREVEIASSSLFGGTKTCTANFCTVSSLSIEVIGEGRVNSTLGDFQCAGGGTCTRQYCNGADPNPPAIVTLTTPARPGSGALFDGWTGDPDCEDGVVTMTADRSCTARFRQPVVSISVTGAGRVTTSSASGLSCREGSPPEVCEAAVPLGAVSRFLARPDPGATFVAWGGDCAGSEPSLPLAVAGDLDCTATFAPSGVGPAEIVSLADDESFGNAAVARSNDELAGSGDFSIVAFRSFATNLTGTPESARLGYVRDRRVGTTRRFTDADHIGPLPATTGNMTLSADGIFAVYEHRSSTTFESNVYRKDLRLPAATPAEVISVSQAAPSIDSGGTRPVISGNGRFVAYIGTSGFSPQVIVRDTCTGAPPSESCTPRSVAVAYDEFGSAFSNLDGSPRISRDGRFVLFQAAGSLGWALYLRGRDGDGDGLFDEPGEATTLLATSSPDVPGTAVSLGFPFRSDLDASGRYVLFNSSDEDLPGNVSPVPDGGRAYLRDTCAGAPPGCTPQYTLVSVRQDGTAIGADFFDETQHSDLGASARYVTFSSRNGMGTLTVADDGYGLMRNLVRDTCIRAPQPCNPGNRFVPDTGTMGLVFVSRPLLSDDARSVVFYGSRLLVAGGFDDYDEVLFTATEIEPVEALAPTINGQTPSGVPAGSPELLLTIHGVDFEAGASVLWNEEPQPRAAIYVSPEKIQVRLSAVDLASPGPRIFRVSNPNGLVSGDVAFTVTAAGP